MASFPPMPLLPITSPRTIEKCASLPLRRSDVFVCSYPKSGTTWTQHIVLSLILADRRHRRRAQTRSDDGERKDDGDDDGGERSTEEYDHVSEYAPFFEIDAHWDPNDDALAEGVRRNHDRLGRRVFNTHLRWDMLPKEREGKRRRNNGDDRAPSSPSTDRDRSHLRPSCGKFIYVTRDLPDACASFYHHLSNQKEGTYAGDFNEFVKDWIAGRVPFGSPLHHLLSFAEGFGDNEHDAAGFDEAGGLADDDRSRPLLLLSYERMKSNLREEVSRIATFLELDDIPAEALEDEILPTFEFRHMRENARRFQPRSVTWLNGYQFLRRGESGDGRRMMGEADDEREGGGRSLIDVFREWVEREGYRGKIGKMVSGGLDKGTAERFLAIVE